MPFNLRPIVLARGDWLNECPECGGNNLHQEDVSVFNPSSPRVEYNINSDKNEFFPQTQVTHVMADGTLTTARVNDNATNNPSPERQGLLISFSCETCESIPTLAILQHKGITFIGWK